MKGPAASLLISFFPARSILAEPLETVSIIAPAGSNGGYDHRARATEDVLAARGLTSSVKIEVVPRAGGTIDLAPFVTGQTRGTSLIVAGAGPVGAIKINNFPVIIDQVTPRAQPAGECQLLIGSDNSDVKGLDNLTATNSRPVPGRCAGKGPCSVVLSVSVSAKTVTAFRCGVKNDELHRGR
jgi:putative tricarboxylic transport membrane protein